MNWQMAIISFFLLSVGCAGLPQALAASGNGPSGDGASREGSPLTLPEALSRVFQSNPEMAVSELEIQAASARVLQAGLKPNPEFSAKAEDFAAMGGTGLSSYTESTVEVSQRLELGGKRQKRIAAAEKEMGIASRAREVKKAELTAAISHAFVDVLAGQERLANQRELNQLARQAHSTVVERVAAGKVSPVEQTRATVALASSELAEEKQLRGLLAAKDRLAALWGGAGRDFDRVAGRFEIPLVPSGLAEPCSDSNANLKLAAATVDFNRAILDLEQAARKPDVTVSAGFRHLNLEDVSAWVASVSIPLPVFDKRQGAIAEARIRVDKSLSEKKAVEWRLHSGLNQARQDREIALLEANILTRTALPAAREALAAVEEGYRFGKFDFLNVLDAQRTHAELQRQYIEAVASGLKAAIEIERLAGCGSPADPSAQARDTKETTHEE